MPLLQSCAQALIKMLTRKDPRSVSSPVIGSGLEICKTSCCMVCLQLAFRNGNKNKRKADATMFDHVAKRKAMERFVQNTPLLQPFSTSFVPQQPKPSMPVSPSVRWSVSTSNRWSVRRIGFEARSEELMFCTWSSKDLLGPRDCPSLDICIMRCASSSPESHN